MSGDEEKGRRGGTHLKLNLLILVLFWGQKKFGIFRVRDCVVG